MMLDVFTLTFLFLLTLVVIAIVLMKVYERGRRDGEEFGEWRERAIWWEKTARAQRRVEAVGAAGPIESASDEWKLPD